FRVFDRHVVMELIAVATHLLDDAHAAGVNEAAAPEPRRVVEVHGLDDERVAFPVADALPIKRREIELLRGERTTIDRDVAVLVVAAVVILVGRIEEDHVVIGLDDARRRAVPRNAERLAGNDRIVLVRPHVELLDVIPELGLVDRTAEHAETRRRDPGIVDEEVVVAARAAELRVDAAALDLRRRAAAVAAARDRVRRAAPAARDVRLAVGAARRFDGRGLLILCAAASATATSSATPTARASAAAT